MPLSGVVAKYLIGRSSSKGRGRESSRRRQRQRQDRSKARYMGRTSTRMLEARALDPSSSFGGNNNARTAAERPSARVAQRINQSTIAAVWQAEASPARTASAQGRPGARVSSDRNRTTFSIYTVELALPTCRVLPTAPNTSCRRR